MSRAGGLSRRSFLTATAVAGPGLTIGFQLRFVARGARVAAQSMPFAPNAWIRITPDNIVTIVVGRSDMGQGSVSGEGRLRVHRVVCAIDCGIAVHPDIVEAPIEGGIAYGLNAALHGEITIAAGRVQQSNFHDYPDDAHR